MSCGLAGLLIARVATDPPGPVKVARADVLLTVKKASLQYIIINDLRVLTYCECLR